MNAWSGVRANSGGENQSDDDPIASALDELSAPDFHAREDLRQWLGRAVPDDVEQL